jgi:hypothetical protein
MSMEHVHAGISIAEFKDAPLSLSLNDGICKFAGDKACAGRIVMEEISMKMERVD